MWDRHKSANGNIDSFAIITTVADSSNTHIPAVLSPNHYESWLDPRITDTDYLLSLLEPSQVPLFVYRTNGYVSHPEAEGSGCLRPYRGRG